MPNLTTNLSSLLNKPELLTSNNEASHLRSNSKNTSVETLYSKKNDNSDWKSSVLGTSGQTRAKRAYDFVKTEFSNMGIKDEDLDSLMKNVSDTRTTTTLHNQMSYVNTQKLSNELSRIQIENQMKTSNSDLKEVTPEIITARPKMLSEVVYEELANVKLNKELNQKQQQNIETYGKVIGELVPKHNLEIKSVEKFQQIEFIKDHLDGQELNTNGNLPKSKISENGICMSISTNWLIDRDVHTSSPKQYFEEHLTDTGIKDSMMLLALATGFKSDQLSTINDFIYHHSGENLQLSHTNYEDKSLKENIVSLNNERNTGINLPKNNGDYMLFGMGGEKSGEGHVLACKLNDSKNDFRVLDPNFGEFKFEDKQKADQFMKTLMNEIYPEFIGLLPIAIQPISKKDENE